MKHMKKLLTMGMSMAIALSLAVPAVAASADSNTDGYDDNSRAYIGGQTITGTPDTDLKPGAKATYKTGTGATVPFIGVIKPTQIKATIPTQVVFDLDPSLNVITDWDSIKTTKPDINYAQVTNPTNLEILNHSTVPMYVYVKDVEVAGDNFTYANLVNATTGLTTDDKNIMFGITSTAANTDTGNPTSSVAGADHWIKPTSSSDSSVLITNNKHYVLNKLKSPAPSDPSKVSKYEGVAPVAANGDAGTLQLWVNAISIQGWESDDVFTIMPTIIVAAQDPDVTPTYTANPVTPPSGP